MARLPHPLGASSPNPQSHRPRVGGLLVWQLPGQTASRAPFFPTGAVIPEPSTLVIWALGLLGLLLVARRRKR